MARRVFLHVGTPKSGTTFLQALWWHHRGALLERGLLLPGDGLSDHFHAASVVTGRDVVLDRLTPRELRIWDRLLQQVGDWDGSALISHELLAPATQERAAEVLGWLGGVADEVHLIVTARDLARQLPSGWQQNVKQGRTETLREFWERLRDDPSDQFWTFQDLPALLDRWATAHQHLVVLPRHGAPRDLLWRQVCALTGVSADGLSVDVERVNESLGLGEAEVMRRVHAAIPAERRGLDVRRIATGWFTQQVLVPAGPGTPWVLPEDVHDWAVARGSELAATLRERHRDRHLDVVGDLDDLVPLPRAADGRTPDDVTDADVAAVAVPALARMLLAELDRRERKRRR